jgi:hypothetical protein
MTNKCEVCGGTFEKTPDGRKCGSGCKIVDTVEQTPGPYSPRKKKTSVPTEA